MRTQVNRILRLMATVLLVWPAAAQADIPDGVFVFDLSGPNQIYDFGSWSECDSDSVAGFFLEWCLNVDMVPDGKGKYTGTASLEFDGDIQGTLIGPATASGKGSDTDRGGSGKLKFAAEGFLNAFGLGTFESKIKLGCSGPITPNGFLTSLCKVKVRVVGEGSASAQALYETQLGGGGWTITLDVTPLDEKKFEGTGTDSLGYDYLVKGKYNAKKGTSSLKATGDKESSSKGAQFQLKNLTNAGTAESKYKVQGYKGSALVGKD